MTAQKQGSRQLSIVPSFIPYFPLSATSRFTRIMDADTALGPIFHLDALYHHRTLETATLESFGSIPRIAVHLKPSP